MMGPSDAVEEFVQAAKELTPKQMAPAAHENLRDVKARHPDVTESAPWFNLAGLLEGLKKPPTEQ